MTSHVTGLRITPTEKTIDNGVGLIDRMWVVLLNRLMIEAVSVWRVCAYEAISSSCDL